VSTRRKFLFDCSAVVAATLTFPAAILADSPAPFRKPGSLSEIPCSAFARHVNTGFRIRPKVGSAIELMLTDVTARPEKPPKPGKRPAPDTAYEKFSLLFSGARDELIPQETYTFTHEALGRFDLFIVPIWTRNPIKMNYEGVINRPRHWSFNENQRKG
jgi:hypothetical protein